MDQQHTSIGPQDLLTTQVPFSVIGREPPMSHLAGSLVSGQTPGGLSSRLRRSGQLPGQGEEIQVLHSVIVGLQQEILLCNNQKKRATDQLACLITLVKNAWQGDTEASQNVGKIVGVSPPEIEVDYSLQDTRRIVAKVKPSVINRWARLTMGVINREYKKHEVDTEMRQRLYLMQRHAYLDEQLSLNVQPGALHNMADSKYISHPEQVTVKYRKGSATRRRLTSKHLYRQPAPPNDGEPLSAKVCFGDLLVTSGAVRPQLISIENYEHMDHVHPEKIGRKNSVESETAHNDNCKEETAGCVTTGAWSKSRPPSGHYASPHRYAANDIYDANSVLRKVKPDNPGSRPTSGILKKSTFGRNVRPASAVVVESNRPLKYETTRPVSAAPKPRPVFRKQNSEPYPMSNTSANNSARAAKITFADDTLCNGDLTGMHYEPGYLGRNDGPSGRDERTKPLSSAAAFQEELKHMAAMEEDFIKGTIDLQKRLGIDASGFVL